MNKEIQDQLEAIVPGKTYPSTVEIDEKDGTKVRFLLQSYVIGMYCAIYSSNRSIPDQTGDNDNKFFVKLLKKEIVRALDNAAVVTIGGIRKVKT